MPILEKALFKSIGMYQFTLNAQFKAPITPLFDAFHKPDVLMEWFAPGQLFVAQVAADFREGGRFRIVMQEPSSTQHSLTGEYVTILPNEALVFSWAWEDNLEESIITTVDCRFEAIDDDTTELALVHSGFANEAERDQHQQGWVSCLEKLSGLTFTHPQ